MSHHGTANTASGPGRGGLWLGVVFLAGTLLWAGDTLGRDPAPQQPEAGKPAGLAAVQMIIRGPEEPMVGQRGTIEVFLLNTGTTPLKDLELHARLDASMEQDSKERDHHATIEGIAPDDVAVVRLQVTPRKVGPGGIDFTLRAKDGATEQVRQVWPILPEGGAGQPALATGNAALKFTIKPLKECLADRPGIVLVHVVNTDVKPMPKKLDLVVSYAAMGQGVQGMGNPLITPDFDGIGKSGRRMATILASNPTRQAEVTLPALGPGENWTLPVRLTPRRIGDLGIAITSKETAEQPLATTRLAVKFDPNLPLEQLVPHRAGATVPTRLPRTLAEVPEVSLEDPCPQNTKPDEAFEHVAHTIEKINHVNKAKMDAFVVALTDKRSDVAGLPFVMGDACRLSPERGQSFQAELSQLRAVMTDPTNLATRMPTWSAEPPEVSVRSRIAAIVQVTGPEGSQVGQQAVKYLAALSHTDATVALAKLAVFAEDEPVRRDAVAALVKRPAKEYTDVLVAGLNYPWPAVARNAADAIVALKRQDLLPQLIAVLDRPDPREPRRIEKEGKPTTIVRELVRINHLRNCLLCHSPMDANKAAALPGGGRGAEEAVKFGGDKGIGFPTGLNAPVPIPGQELPQPTPSGGYGQFTIPDILVSFDVTYLRQDFSVKLPVVDAKPWPETQRFDFLVRTREVTAKEADAYRALVKKDHAGDRSPYHQAALAALRQLTGKDAEPTADAWRKVLGQDRTEE